MAHFTFGGEKKLMPDTTVEEQQIPAGETTTMPEATSPVKCTTMASIDRPGVVETPASPTVQASQPAAEKPPTQNTQTISDVGHFALETGTVVAASILGGMVLGPFGAMLGGALASGACNYMKQAYQKGGTDKVDTTELITSTAIGAIPGAGGAMFKGLFGGLLKFSPIKTMATGVMGNLIGRTAIRTTMGAAYGFVYPGALDIAKNPQNADLVSFYEKGKAGAIQGAVIGAGAGALTGLHAGLGATATVATHATRIAMEKEDLLGMKQTFHRGSQALASLAF